MAEGPGKSSGQAARSGRRRHCADLQPTLKPVRAQGNFGCRLYNGLGLAFK